VGIQKKGVALQIKNFDNYSYVDAIATYEKVAEKGYKDEKMFQKLGDSLFYSRFDQGREWYLLFEMNPFKSQSTTTGILNL
jgi:hypothetical protein